MTLMKRVGTGFICFQSVAISQIRAIRVPFAGLLDSLFPIVVWASGLGAACGTQGSGASAAMPLS
ncbi:MAG: hypothetical protein HOO93_01910 [Methyloglobulus sp.]|nr:hypothetical protein [Methyloglobulus sp.]